MSAEGRIVARSVRTGGPVCVEWRGGVITGAAPSAEPAPQGLWIAPGLLDLQVNGFAGVDFQDPSLDEAGLLKAAQALREHGCDRWLATLITDAWPRLLEQLRRLSRLRAGHPGLGRAIAGFHVEGPFLSAEDGFRGTHDAAWMCDPSPERIDELRQAAPEVPLLLTLAPERPGALAAIERAVSLGMRVSLGHTNASLAVLEAAAAAGASGFTHLANGCPRLLDRHDNILWRVLSGPRLAASVIPDGIHVSPALFGLIHRLQPDSLFYVTDAMSAAGAPPGRYRLGALELEVGEDRVVRRPGAAVLSGSAVTPIDAVWRAAGMLGGDWRGAWRRFSDAPAGFMGLPEGLAPGAAASFVLLRDPGPAGPGAFEMSPVR